MSRTLTIAALALAAAFAQPATAAPSAELAALNLQIRQARAEERDLRATKRAKRDQAAIARKTEQLAKLQARLDALRAQ